MPTAMLIELRTSVLGIYSGDGPRTAFMIPAGAFVKILSGPNEEDRMIDILWDGRVIAAFAVDIVNRGEEVETSRRGRSTFA